MFTYQTPTWYVLVGDEKQDFTVKLPKSLVTAMTETADINFYYCDQST